jgi:hypothetical protein
MTLFHAKQSDIDNFDFNKYNIDSLCIIGDYIDHLIIPDGVEWVSANRLGLKSLYIPDSVRTLYINNNFLACLDLPENIENLYAKKNYLTDVRFRKPPTKLISMDLQENRLTTLDFIMPKTIEILRLRKNCFSIIPDHLQHVINTLDNCCL